MNTRKNTPYACVQPKTNIPALQEKTNTVCFISRDRFQVARAWCLCEASSSLAVATFSQQLGAWLMVAMDL